MNDETLKRRAGIIWLLYTRGPMLGSSIAPARNLSHGVVAEDLLALLEQDAVMAMLDGYALSDAAQAAMDLGVRTAAECIAACGALPVYFLPVYRNAAQPWSPHITLADCAAWAEAIVSALEDAVHPDNLVYMEALKAQRTVARGDRLFGAPESRYLHGLARRMARHRCPFEARAYAAIIAVRTLAAEAARREQT